MMFWYKKEGSNRTSVSIGLLTKQRLNLQKLKSFLIHSNRFPSPSLLAALDYKQNGPLR